MSDTLPLLLSLFEGNEDAIGTEDGGCLRLAPGRWRTELERHFTGDGPPVGVYPIFDLDGEPFCSWGCIDYDDGSTSLTHAYNTSRLLQRFSVASWIEVSRSKGHHLWVFLEHPMPVALVRRALVASQQMLGIPPKEVNPKQWSLAEGQMGNYVRLPYPCGLGPLAEFNRQGGRRVVISVLEGDPGDVMVWGLQEFALQALGGLVRQRNLEVLAERYVEPPKPIDVDTEGVSTHVAEAVSRCQPILNPLAYTIWSDGPSELVPDRSGTLARLAHKLAGNEPPISARDALCLLIDADRRWGKFHGRPDAEDQLARMVGRAFASHPETVAGSS